jgi:hypothetical protein
MPMTETDDARRAGTSEERQVLALEMIADQVRIIAQALLDANERAAMSAPPAPDR